MTITLPQVLHSFLKPHKLQKGLQPRFEAIETQCGCFSAALPKISGEESRKSRCRISPSNEPSSFFSIWKSIATITSGPGINGWPRSARFSTSSPIEFLRCFRLVNRSH